MKSRRPNQPRVIRSAVAEKPSRHLASRKSSGGSHYWFRIVPRRIPCWFFLFFTAATQRTEIASARGRGTYMHTCTHARSHAMRYDARRIVSKGYYNFPMQIAKVAQPAKITVGNNTVDWEVELARASRETDNISLGRPLRRTIK